MVPEACPPPDGFGVASRVRAYPHDVPTLRLFASAREAAGTARDTIPGSTVDEVLAVARDRYGATFVALLDSCKVWVNGEPAAGDQAVGEDDEVAVLPPVSGGAGGSGWM
jgi:molybdopterin converting factor small subunit